VKKRKIVQLPSEEESVASEIMAVVKDESIEEENETISEILHNEKEPIETDVVLDNFFAVDKEDEIEDESVVYDELALLIENQIKELLSHSCFDIDVVEVDVRDNTALIFIEMVMMLLCLSVKKDIATMHFLICCLTGYIQSMNFLLNLKLQNS